MIGRVTTKRALITSFVVDGFDVVSNVAVAVITGSAIVLSEAMEGLADLCSVGLLLIGRKRSSKKADQRHQFGYGKELYFWALLSAVVMLMITATLSFYFGLQKFLNPQPVEWPILAFAVLAFAIVTNGYALSLSVRRILGDKPVSKLSKMFRASPLLAPKTTFVLDAAGTLAALFGFVNLTIYSLTGDARFDGIGAMFISVVLAVFAVVLLIGVRNFIAGQSVPDSLARTIRQTVLRIEGVESVVGLRTMLLGSSSTLIIVDVNLANDLKTDQIEQIIDHVQVAVDRVVPGETQVQVELEAPNEHG